METQVEGKLSGNYQRDVDRGVFRIDENDPEYQEMFEKVQSFNIPGENGRRLDVGETATITRQLLYVKAKTYDVKYPMFRSRDFIPVSHDVPTGAETWSYWQYDGFAMAKAISNYAQDFPRVDLKATEFLQKITGLGDSYTYTIQDMRRTAFMASNGTSRGASLDVKRAALARRGIEAAIDDIASNGLTDAGFTGFVNNAAVPVLTAPTGVWATATAVQIIADLNYGWQQIMLTTNQVEVPDTYILSVNAYNIVTGLPFSTLANLTVAQWFIQNNPHIKDMDQWYKLNKAAANGTTSRQVCYRRDPDAVFMEIPQEFEQFAPQIEMMQYNIPCHARFGGVAFPYPLAAAYLDGIG